ncbi:MAG TPA: hypothetical protein VHG93_27890 [Longimicrobium sp.]|nr:hypothetical protein [Longimicrobium sp.]
MFCFIGQVPRAWGIATSGYCTCRITHCAWVPQPGPKAGPISHYAEQPDARPAAVADIIRKKDRNWAVLDPQGQLVCLTVCKRGAVEVVRRLAA